jgi:hypothetical protein
VVKRYVYLARSTDSNETLAFEREQDAQELVQRGQHRGPFTVELIPAPMQQLADAVGVEQPESGGSIRV